MNYENERAFIEKLIEMKAKDELANIPKNDWNALQDLGWKKGFNIHVRKLKNIMPRKFYEDFQWDKP